MKAHKFAQKKEALTRVVSLFDLARNDPKLAKKYVLAARRLCLKNRLRLPLEFRRSFCVNCSAFFAVGKNCSVRKRKSGVVIRCLECQNVTRIGVKK